MLAHRGVDRHQAGNGTRQHHGNDDDLGRRNPCIDRCRRAFPKGADLIPKTRAIHQQIDDDTHGKGHEKRYVGRGRFREVDTQRSQNLVQRGQVGDVREAGRGTFLCAFQLQGFDQQIAHQRGGDEVEHDCGDHHVAAAFGLQIGWDQCPASAKQAPGDHRENQSDGPMGHQDGRDEQTSQADAQAANHRLTLSANVEHRGLERDGHGKPGEDEVGGVIKRVAPAICRPKRAVDHGHQRLERVFPDGKNHQTRQNESDQQVQKRNKGDVSPFRHLVHQLSPSPVTPAINRPSSRSSV